MSKGVVLQLTDVELPTFLRDTCIIASFAYASGAVAIGHQALDLAVKATCSRDPLGATWPATRHAFACPHWSTAGVRRPE